MDRTPRPLKRIAHESSTEDALMKLQENQQENRQKIIQDLGFLLAQHWLDQRIPSNTDRAGTRKTLRRHPDGELPFE